MNNKFGHLTSYSVNKKNKNAKHTTLWNLKQLREAYHNEGLNFDFVNDQIKDLVIKTLISADHHIVPILEQNPSARNACFETFSFDIMIDNQQKAWVIKVDAEPTGLTSTDPLQERIATTRLCDAFTLVGIVPYDKVKLQASSSELTQLSLFSKSSTTEELENIEFRGNEDLTSDEIGVLMDLEDEQSRRGNYERIFPDASNTEYYIQFFKCKRY